MNKSSLQQLYQYDHWANERVLNMLRDIVTDHARSRGLIAHILAAQLIWMTRLHERDSSDLAIFPDHTLDQCGAWLEHNRESYAAFLEAIDEGALDHQIHYANTRGESYSTPIREILIHVANH